MSKLLTELQNPFNACPHKDSCIERIKELEAALVKEKDAQIHYYNAAMDHANRNKELGAVRDGLIREVALQSERIDWTVKDNAEKAIQIADLTAERDRVMRENGKLNCHIDDLEAERDRLSSTCMQYAKAVERATNQGYNTGLEAAADLAEACEIGIGSYTRDVAEAIRALKEES